MTAKTNPTWGTQYCRCPLCDPDPPDADGRELTPDELTALDCERDRLQARREALAEDASIERRSELRRLVEREAVRIRR